MTSTVDTVRRKQLLFRAKHRGSKEGDVLMGAFAEAYLKECPDVEVEVFARLLAVEDPDLWDWIVDKTPVPAQYNTATFQALKVFVASRFAD